MWNQKNLKNRKIIFTYVSDHCASIGTIQIFGHFLRDDGGSACRSQGQGPEMLASNIPEKQLGWVAIQKHLGPVGIAEGLGAETPW